jgi:hypothetical protein
MMSRRRLFARMRRRIALLVTRLDLRMHNGNLKELVKNSIDVYAEKTGADYAKTGADCANGTALMGVIENCELQLGPERTGEMISEMLEDGALTKDETKTTEPVEPR